MKIRIFLISLLISLPFWWGVNVLRENLENFLYKREITTNPQLLITVAHQIELAEKLEKMKPIRDRNYDDLELLAESAISVFINEKGEERILFEKDIDKKLPIASLAKLMTAVVVLDNYNLSEKTQNLLYLTLIESNNDAALSLARLIEEEAFVGLMNSKAQYLGLENTHFINATGLDDENSFSYSTVQDLVKFARYLTLEKPLIWDISTIPEFGNGINTNELLGKISGIIGGKTGKTSRAGECLLLAVRAPKNKGYIINVILNSKNRFEEMEKLINWVQYGYRW